MKKKKKKEKKMTTKKNAPDLPTPSAGGKDPRRGRLPAVSSQSAASPTAEVLVAVAILREATAARVSRDGMRCEVGVVYVLATSRATATVEAAKREGSRGG